MQSFSLNTTLIDFSDKPTPENKDPERRLWTVRNAVEGVQVFGGIGSGKTSGSGRTLALKYLKAGFGGLVLTAKPGEKKDWYDYCQETGRINDLLIVEPNGEWFFNFLDYEVQVNKDGGAITDNIVQVLKTIIHASDEKEGGGSKEPFWDNALDMLLFNTIDLCTLAYGAVSVRLLYDIVQSLPKTLTSENASAPKEGSEKDPEKKKLNPYQKARQAAFKKASACVPAWRAEQTPERLARLDADKDARFTAMEEEIPEMRLLKLVYQFISSYTSLGSKTRSVVDVSFSGFLFRLLRDPVYSLFCDKTNFSPEASRDGKIILIDLPVKKYHKVGRDSQIMFKYMWQRAMERSPVDDDRVRPVFLWADEAQHFLHEHDAEFQATARSSRVATVYLSQNLPNYYATMGGGKYEYRVKSFLGTLNTKIFHANADIETNRYASELIGERLEYERSTGQTQGKDSTMSMNRTPKYQHIVRPEDFPRLKTGGDHNDDKVEAYMHVQGTVLKEANHKLLVFKQPHKEDNPKSPYS